ncbi:MAG: M23 family metallopeptidase [Anaerolinea sp.]|nr:M23 family metallopeptidase [Anaerolinea sp.]
MQRSGFTAFVLVLLVVAGFIFLLWSNARPAPELRVIVPTENAPTESVSGWEQILEAGFGENSTPLPTIAIPTGQYIPPTLPPASVGGTPIAAGDLGGGTNPELFSVAATPTRPPATLALLATEIPLTAISVTRAAVAWQPPPLIPPLSRDPLGRDHYYFLRPVDSNATNRGLFYYPYGSDGPENQWRIHAGIDMPNDIGQTVRAAGSGLVTWSGPGFQNTSSYGNVVLIEHDFGYNGQPVYTLYAHLSAVLVFNGQRVNAGDAIGLVGNSGRVTGPHVHFEVRYSENAYGKTVNPVLWMVPYVGTGVIAGRLTDRSGNLVQDADITIRSYATGLTIDTTATYIFQGTGVDVNSDPVWGENFVVGDVPVGRVEVIANLNGERISRLINVVEGTTNFVELTPALSTGGEASG